MTKRCSICEQHKPLPEFRHAKGYKNGIHSSCKACEALRLAEWRKANPEKRQAQHMRANAKHKRNQTGLYSGDPKIARRRRNAYLLRTYGITIEQTEEMLSRQDGRCAVCASEEPLVVDHCHRSGRVRALLCDRCNRALGVLDDDVDLLLGLRDYVIAHRAVTDERSLTTLTAVVVDR